MWRKEKADSYKWYSDLHTWAVTHMHTLVQTMDNCYKKFKYNHVSESCPCCMYTCALIILELRNVPLCAEITLYESISWWVFGLLSDFFGTVNILFLNYHTALYITLFFGTLGVSKHRTRIARYYVLLNWTVAEVSPFQNDYALFCSLVCSLS